MAAGPDESSDLANLFVAITGQEWIVDQRESDIDRLDDSGTERAVAAYLDASTRDSGFDDVITEPQQD